MNKRRLMVCCGGTLLLLLGCQEAWTSGMAGKQDHKANKGLEPDPSQVEPEPEPMILPNTYVAAGQLAEGRGDMAMAVTMYRKAVAVGKDYVDAYNRLGLALTKVGHHQQAVDVFRSAIQVAPDKPLLHNNLAYSYISLRQWDKAEASLNTALDLQPDFNRARVNLGLVLARTGRYDQAMKQFLLVLPPASAHYNLGLMYEMNRRYELACESFSQALALDPNLGPAKAALKRTEQAITMQIFEEPHTALVRDDAKGETTSPDSAAESEPTLADGATQAEPTPIEADLQAALPEAETASTVVTEAAAKQQTRDELIMIEPDVDKNLAEGDADPDLAVPERVLPAAKAGSGEIRLPEATSEARPVVSDVHVVEPAESASPAKQPEIPNEIPQSADVRHPTPDPEKAQKAAAETLAYVVSEVMKWWHAPPVESAWQRLGRHFEPPTGDLASVDAPQADAAVLLDPESNR